MTPSPVIYVRLSREDLQGATATDQKFADRVAICVQLAQRHGLTVAPSDIYIERQSGADIAKRPQFQTVLARCRNGDVSHLITPYQDRLGRGDLADQAIIENALLDGEVTLITTESVTKFDETYEGASALSYEIRALFARHFLRDIKRKRKESNRQRDLQGRRSCSFAPYGYVWRKAEYHPVTRQLLDPPHHEIIGDLCITDAPAAFTYATQHAPECIDGETLNEAKYIALARRQGQADGSLLAGVSCTGGEYAVLCEIFERLKSVGFHIIAADLNARNIPTSRARRYRDDANRKWAYSTLYEIAKNPFYAGFPTHRYTPDRTGKSKKMGEQKHIAAESEQTYPRPVRLAEWNDLKRIISARMKRTPKKESEALTASLLHCQKGRIMGFGGVCYRCNCYRYGDHHPYGLVNASRVNAAVRQIAEAIIQNLPDDFLAAPPAPPAPHNDEVIRLQRDISQKRRDLQKMEETRDLFQRIGQGDAHLAAMSALSTEIAALQQQSDEIAATEPPATPIDKSLLAAIKAAPFDELWEEMTPEEIRALMSALIVRIEPVIPSKPRQWVKQFRYVVNPILRPYHQATVVSVK